MMEAKAAVAVSFPHWVECSIFSLLIASSSHYQNINVPTQSNTSKKEEEGWEMEDAMVDIGFRKRRREEDSV